MRDDNDRNAAPRGGRVTRRGLFGLAAGCLAAAFARPAKADLFGGDITVLLAQLEQQLALVSNAITTVQRVTETAQRAAKMVTHAEQLGAMVTGQQGLNGFLSGLKGIVDGGRGLTRDLQTINIRGGQWKDRITNNVRSGHGALSMREAVALSREAGELDRAFLRDMNRVSGGFARVMNSFDALESAADAVHEAQAVTGVVGQVQLLGREVLQLTGIAAELHASMSMTGALQAEELARQAAEREDARARTQVIFGDFEVIHSSPTTIRWDLDRQ